MAKQSTVWYVADFETTTEKFYNDNGYTKVWLYAISDMNGNIVNYGTSIEEFIDCIRYMYGKTIYFHNLKFDGVFILDYMLKIGFKHYEKFEENTSQGISTLIGEMGEFYSIDIRFGKHKNVHIHDSLKLLPFKVERIAKDFGLPMLKGKIDYDTYEVTPETLEYVFNDVKIVALALRDIKENGMNKMTTASSAYSYYTSLFDKWYFRAMYPDLDIDFLNTWREAYRGGRSMVNPKYERKILHNVYRYDINSMYPFIMHDLPLPYGEPIPITTRGYYKFELYHIKVIFSLKENHLPSLLKKEGLYNTTDSYYKDSDGIEDIYISNIDYELFERNYDILHIEFLEMYGFYTTRVMFKRYIDYWYERKLQDKGAKRITDKLMLNSLYGKFGTNPVKYKKLPYINEDGVVSFEKSAEEEGKHYYLPVAIAITSWAHKLLDDAIHLIGVKNFVYCDTDSVHSLVKFPDYMIHESALGKFKLEAYETKCKYVRQKCYVTYENEQAHITCAGMPDTSKQRLIDNLDIDTLLNMFDIGLVVNSKLLPKRVNGGVILRETTFEIK